MQIISRESAILMLVGLCLTTIGCSAPLVEYQPGHAETIRPAPSNGMFTLKSAFGNIESTTLSAGEPIGFARQGNQLLAVKGQQTLPLCDGKYAWLVDSDAKAHPVLLPYTDPTQLRSTNSSDWGIAALLGYDVVAAAWDVAMLRDTK